jgi:DNA polymerase-3 subunit epsilon
VKWKEGKVIESFQSFVKPQRPMGEAVIAIHKITNEMVATAPPIKDVLPLFDKFAQGSVLMAHHAPFDLGFLADEYEKLSLPLPTSSVLDSCLLARRAFPESINHRLATLVSLFDIKVNAAHRALDDSKACQEVTFKCMEKFGVTSSLDFIFQMQGGAMKWPRFSMKDLMANETTKTCVEACRGQLVIEIIYMGGSRPGVPRRLTPQGLVRNPNGDYIVGLCHIENTEKRFFLNRISSAKILD